MIQGLNQRPGGTDLDVAILDRLLHQIHVISIDGPSYRDWVHKQQVEARHAERRPGT